MGKAIALSGERALLGDPFAYSHEHEGRAHVFRRTEPGWIHEGELKLDAATLNDTFGWELDIDGTRAVVGTLGWPPPGNRAFVFEFRDDRWVETAMLTEREDGSGDFFSESVSCSAGRVAVGGAFPAAVYVFEDFGAGAAVEYCTTSPNSDWIGARISYGGALGVGDATFELRAQACANQSTGLFFYGEARAQIPWQAGYLCVGAGSRSLFRFPPVQTDSIGSATHLVDFTQPPAGAGPGRILPGSTWYFQFAFHDGGALDFTEGMRVTFCP